MSETKVGLFDALAALNELAGIVDAHDDVELDQLLVARFGATEDAVAESIDRRKKLANQIRIQIAGTKAEMQDLRAWQRRMERMEESLKRTTLHALMQFPDLPARDSSGRKLSVCKTAALDVDLALHSKSFSNIVDPDDLDGQEEYLQEVRFYTLDTKKLKADLTAGTSQVPWARLQINPHLRGL